MEYVLYACICVNFDFETLRLDIFQYFRGSLIANAQTSYGDIVTDKNCPCWDSREAKKSTTSLMEETIIMRSKVTIFNFFNA